MNEESTTETPTTASDDETLELIHHESTVTFDTFKQLDIRVAEVKTARPHPNADRLLLLTVQTAPDEIRQLVAGIRGHYEPEALVGRKVVVLCNLEPAKIRGEWSNGMILAASSGDKEQVKFLTPEADLPAGSVIS